MVPRADLAELWPIWASSPQLTALEQLPAESRRDRGRPTRCLETLVECVGPRGHVVVPTTSAIFGTRSSARWRTVPRGGGDLGDGDTLPGAVRSLDPASRWSRSVRTRHELRRGAAAPAGTDQARPTPPPPKIPLSPDECSWASTSPAMSLFMHSNASVASAIATTARSRLLTSHGRRRGRRRACPLRTRSRRFSQRVPRSARCSRETNAAGSSSSGTRPQRGVLRRDRRGSRASSPRTPTFPRCATVASS